MVKNKKYGRILCVCKDFDLLGDCKRYIDTGNSKAFIKPGYSSRTHGNESVHYADKL